MKADKTQWERKRLKIKDLRPHPDQALLYGGTTTPAEDEAFARDLVQRGQIDDVHVLPFPNAAKLPKGTILDGWRRVKQSEANGETEVDCVLRNDLRKATAAEVAIEFANFNPPRRHLTPLTRARCVKYQMTAQERCQGRPDSCGIEKLKSQVGGQLGVSTRTVNRLLAILDAPKAIQEAYDRGEISQVEAAKIGSHSAFFRTISEEKQDEMCQRIAAGEPPKQAIKDYLPARNGRHKRTTPGFTRFLTDLQRALDDLEDRTAKIYRQAIVENRDLLKRGRRFLDRLIAQSKQKLPGVESLREEVRAAMATQGRNCSAES